MKFVQAILLTALFLFISVAHVNGYIIASSTFDTGFDGWGALPGETTSLSHMMTGGNPGGYINNVDTGPTSGNIVAPAEFTGDWSSLDGSGLLSWDFNMFDPGVGTVLDLRAYIFGPGGSATYLSGIVPPQGSWISVAASIMESVWNVDTGNWNSILSDVTELRLMIENVVTTARFETTGIDNVFLSNEPEPSSVPEPSSILLFGSAISLIFAYRKKKIHSRCSNF